MNINATLIGQLITFALLVWFTLKYVWPPITKTMEERQKRIADGLQAAERSQRELELAEQKVAALLREAKQEAARLIEQAHKRSEQIVEEAKQNARIESARLLDHIKEEITVEVNQAKEMLRKQLAGLAVAGAEKIIQRSLDPVTQADLLDKFAAEI